MEPARIGIIYHLVNQNESEKEKSLVGYTNVGNESPMTKSGKRWLAMFHYLPNIRQWRRPVSDNDILIYIISDYDTEVNPVFQISRHPKESMYARLERYLQIKTQGPRFRLISARLAQTKKFQTKQVRSKPIFSQMTCRIFRASISQTGSFQKDGSPVVSLLNRQSIC